MTGSTDVFNYKKVAKSRVRKFKEKDRSLELAVSDLNCVIQGDVLFEFFDLGVCFLAVPCFLLYLSAKSTSSISGINTSL